MSLPNSTSKIGYWQSISDDELLEVQFTTDDPTSLPNIVETLPERNEVPIVEITYNVAGSPKGKVRCIHCKYDNHYQGFVLKFKNGCRILVGRICGKKIYNADFNLAANEFEHARTRASYLRRRKTALVLAPLFVQAIVDLNAHPARRMFSDLKATFEKQLPSLMEQLQKIVRKNDGRLFIEEKVRDYDAEARRQDREGEKKSSKTDITRKQIAVEVEKLRRLGIFQSKKPEQDERSKSQLKSQEHIYKYLPKEIGTLAGQEFFHVDRSPYLVIKELEEQARKAIENLQRGGLQNRELKKTFDNLQKIIDMLMLEVVRLASPIEVFEFRNLQNIAQWATYWAKGKETYSASIGAITFHPYNADHFAIKCPAEYAKPSTAPFENFRAATDVMATIVTNSTATAPSRLSKGKA